jgi:hypothetical protein
VRANRGLGLSIMLDDTRYVITNPGLAGAILLAAFIGVMAWAWWPVVF